MTKAISDAERERRRDAARIRMAVWRLANPERARAVGLKSDRKRREVHRDRLNENRRARYAAARENETIAEREHRKTAEGARRDREQAKVTTRAWRAANRDRSRAAAAEWRAAYPDKARALRNAWIAANPEKVRASKAMATLNRRARKRDAFIEWVDPTVVFERDEGICKICGDPIGDAKWHVDHIIPLVRDGEHSYANVQLSHARCNLVKSTKVKSA